MPAAKHEVTIKAEAVFVGGQSDIERRHYVFAYRIRITNTGTVAAKLISRHWIISNAEGHVEEVKGDGVIGEQPLLQPNESFEYTSGAALTTPIGTMRGSYQMLAEDGVKFDAPIPEFTLAMPRTLH